MSIADLYGRPSEAVAKPAATTVSGPNQSAVAGPNSPTNASGGKAPAFSWLGFVLALVLLRVLAESQRGQ